MVKSTSGFCHIARETRWCTDHGKSGTKVHIMASLACHISHRMVNANIGAPKIQNPIRENIAHINWNMFILYRKSRRSLPIYMYSMSVSAPYSAFTLATCAPTCVATCVATCGQCESTISRLHNCRLSHRSVCLSVCLERLKMRKWKMRYSQNCRSGKSRSKPVGKAKQRINRVAAETF